MKSSPHLAAHGAAKLHQVFPGASKMALLMRDFDWSKTPLGAPHGWPAHLKTALSLCLTSHLPVVMVWGADFSVLYNDACSSFLGPDRHPRFLGQPARDCWPDIWPTIGPLLAGVVETGEATSSDDVRMVFARRLPREEVYVRFSFGPILGPDGRTVDGIFCPCTETTERVVGERRLETLRRLGARGPEGRSQAAVCRDVARVLEDNPADVPFAALFAGDGKQAVLIDGCGLADAAHLLPRNVALDPSALRDALPAQLRGAPPIGQTLVLPIPGVSQDALCGLLLVGASPNRVLDEEYRSFFEMLAHHAGSALADAGAHAAERARVQALAEIDRAKTAFFTNVSHEFRTPLALMLGPLEDLQDQMRRDTPGDTRRETLAGVQRNAERLLKLVNTLLDYARIEGGRGEAAFEPADLAALTADIASTFRAPCERAGLRLSVDCKPLTDPLFVDREMWEKIVLNLLSNAFKFTLQGEIAVRLRARDGQAELQVYDSGTGIAASELPKLFRRFQRIAGTEGRSIEGSGIGLALASELVKLHGGTIRAASKVGRGSVFTVRLPFGSDHLAPRQLRAARDAAPLGVHARPFVSEALQWLPKAEDAEDADSGFAALEAGAQPPRRAEQGAPCVLVVDDNADLRDYLRRLLGARYRVRLADDGAAGLEAARKDPPDLIVCDVVMPRLDGLGLLRALRAGAGTRTVPVILLSAHAGEDARIEGLDAGADDYLTKPFSSRELLARVAAQLAAARFRREADAARGETESMLRIALDSARAGAWTWRPESAESSGSPEAYRVFGIAPGCVDAGLRVQIRARIHPDDVEPALAAVKQQLAERGSIDVEYRIRHPATGVRWLHSRGRLQDDGRVVGIVIDATERKVAEQTLRDSELRLSLAQEAAHLGSWEIDIERGTIECTATHKALYGLAPDAPLSVEMLYALIHDEDREMVRAEVRRGVEERAEFRIEYRAVWHDGSVHWLAGRGRAQYDVQGRPVKRLGITLDITARKAAESALDAERQRLRAVVEQGLAGIGNLDLNGRLLDVNARYCEIVGRSAGELRGMALADITHPDDRARNIEALHRLMRGEIPSSVQEKRFVRPDGSAVWTSVHASLVRDADARPSHLVGVVLDISERKAREQAATEAAERLRIAMQAAHLGSFSLDLASGQMECSAQCKANFGLAPGDALPYARLFELMHIEDRERVQQAVRHAVETRTDYEAEYRTVWPGDGSVHWIVARGRAIYAEDGTPQTMIGVTQDVTVRRLAEEALRDSEARVRETLDAMPQIVFTAAPDGAITGMNRYAQLYAGRKEEEMLGTGFSEQIHSDDAARAFRTWGRAMRSGTPCELECRIRQADGEYRWWLTRALPALDRHGNVRHWVGTSTDIDDRKRYEGELTAMRNALSAQVADLTTLHEQTARLTAGRRMDAVLDELMQGALALTGAPKGMLTLADRRHDDLELVASAGFRGPYLLLVQRVPKGAGACGTCYLRRARVIVEDTDTDPIFEPYREAARIGGYRSAHSTPLLARDGSVLGVLTLFAAEPRRPDGREMRLIDLLSAQAAGYVENLRLLDELQKADRRKDEFLATLAHELRNPLAPIRNSLHLLRMSGPRVSAERLHEMLDRQVNHMVRLVDDLMEVSRISRGKIDLLREPLELAGVLRTAIETSRPLIERGGHALDIVLPGEALQVDGDAVRLAQVFANLLNNAAKYTDQGGRIEVSLRRDGDEALVSVRDSGIGISAEQLPHLFEMFAQIDRGSRAQGGLGIGLSLAQRLAQMHGGRVEAESEGLGHGSRFVVRLPLSRAPAAGNDAAAVAAARLAARRLLVVDDNRDAADSLGMVLGFLGAEVRVAHDGPSALAAIESWKPQVVLLDLGMPGMDGFEVARRIRAGPQGDALTLVALTGWGQEQDRERTRASGFDHHLVKPADINVLQALLASLETLGERA